MELRNGQSSRQPQKNSFRFTVWVPLLVLLGLALIAAIWGIDKQARAAARPSLRFVVLGDSQAITHPINRVILHHIINRIRDLAPRPDFVIFLGDIALYGSEKNWRKWLESMKMLSNAGIKLYVVKGNHELYTRGLGQRLENQFLYQKVFSFLPGNGPPGYEKLVYSFEYGNSFFVVLDTFYINPQTKVKNKNRITPTQLKWLTRQLKATSARHKFAFGHAPPYSLERPHKQHPSFRSLWKILDDHDFAIYFAGHEHLYSRRIIDQSIDPARRNKVMQIVTGGAGGQRRRRLHQQIIKRLWNVCSCFHYTVIDVKEDEVSGVVYQVSRTEENEYRSLTHDRFTVVK